MGFLIEMICELIFGGIDELSKDKKVTKYIRYPLAGLLVLFYVAVIGIMLYASLLTLKENILLGIILITGTLVMLAVSIIMFREDYLRRKNIEQDKSQFTKTLTPTNRGEFPL